VSVYGVVCAPTDADSGRFSPSTATALSWNVAEVSRGGMRRPTRARRPPRHRQRRCM